MQRMHGLRFSIVGMVWIETLVKLEVHLLCVTRNTLPLRTTDGQSGTNITIFSGCITIQDIIMIILHVGF